MVDIRRKESGSGQRLLTAYVLQDCDRIGYLDLSVAVHVAEQHHEFCLCMQRPLVLLKVARTIPVALFTEVSV